MKSVSDAPPEELPSVGIKAVKDVANIWALRLLLREVVTIDNVLSLVSITTLQTMEDTDLADARESDDDFLRDMLDVGRHLGRRQLAGHVGLQQFRPWCAI